MGVYGDRTPGVWLSDDGLLHVASAVNDYLGGWNITTPLVAGKWFNLEISQLLINSKVLKLKKQYKLTCLFCSIILFFCCSLSLMSNWMEQVIVLSRT